jgi:hypothetical protein
MPSAASAKRKYVKDGGCMVAGPTTKDGAVSLYAFRGNKSPEFYMFNGDTWAKMCSLGFGYKPPHTDSGKINKKYPGKGAALCWNTDSIIYAVKGNGTREFWAYLIDSDTWIQKAFIPSIKGVKGGTSICHYNGEVYLLAGSQKATGPNFYVYDPTLNVWDTLRKAPLGPYNKVWPNGSSITELGGTIYALKAGDKFNFFYAYNIADNIWVPKEELPIADSLFGRYKKKLIVKYGGAMTSSGSAIYAIKGGNTNVFWKYTPNVHGDTGIWAREESIPRLSMKSVPATGAALAFTDEKVYLLKGNNTPEFWQYTPSTKYGTELIANSTEQSNVQALTTRYSTLATKLAVTPNPFTKLATIRYTVPISGKVTIKLYNAIGRLVETLADEYLNAGTYTTRLSAKSLAKGVYFLKFETDTYKSDLKLIVQ